MEGIGLTLKVIFATPSLSGPTAPYLAALEASVPLVTGAGWEESYVQEVGCPYISHARASMTRRALDKLSSPDDVIMYLDYDLSWKPKDLLALLSTKGDVVAGTYRYKKDEEEYMGAINTLPDGRPLVRSDGTLSGFRVPAGFLKVTVAALRRMMIAYPELLFGDPDRYSFDLFQHGAYKGVWYGEDMAFSRRWIDCGGEIALLPDMNLTHHSRDKAYPGNFHEFLMRQPGGSKAQPSAADLDAICAERAMA